MLIKQNVNTELTSVNFSYILAFDEVILCLVAVKMKFFDIKVSKEEQTGATRRSRACAEIY